MQTLPFGLIISNLQILSRAYLWITFMKITVSQQGKKINIIFSDKKLEKSFIVAKSDEFLGCIDVLMKKNKIKLEMLKNARLEFRNTGLLTERIIRVIILGLSF
jgi:hypothetical protein